MSSQVNKQLYGDCLRFNPRTMLSATARSLLTNSLSGKCRFLPTYTVVLNHNSTRHVTENTPYAKRCLTSDSYEV